MAGDWPETTWGDIAELKYGKAMTAYTDQPNVARVYGTNGPIGWHDIVLQPGPGVIVGRKGAYRGVHYADHPFWVIDTAYYLNPLVPMDLRWAYYWLVDYDVNNIDDGSPIPSTTREAFGFTPIKFPPLDEQVRIADLLASLDAKNDLNRQMAATLEEMARALFKSWFVDFDPVHAKAEGRDTGLPADIAALFPDSFDDEGLPDGWRSGSLDDLADTNSESWKASSHPEEVDYVDLSNCKWGNIDGTTQYRWEDAPSRARRVARAGDTIFGTVRPGNGSYAFVAREGLTVSTGFAVLRPKEVIYREMVYFAATSIDNIRWLEQLAVGHGGAYPAVNPDKVSATVVPVSCERVAEAFASITADMIDRIESLKQQSTDLKQFRDTLLPKLLSGELRVADAESVIAAA